MVVVASVCQVTMAQWLMCEQYHYWKLGGLWFNSPWVLYILAFWLVIFTKFKTKCTPTGLPVGTPTIFPWTPHVGLPVDSLVYWDSYGTSIGLPVDSQYSLPLLLLQNMMTPSSVPVDSHGTPWEWTGSPHGFPGTPWLLVA